MAYKVITTYVRPNTGVDFPKMSDHDSDYYDWMRAYYADNGISISFELSEDELTLIATTECDSRSIWDTYRAADDARGDYEGGVKAALNSDLSSRSISIKIDAIEDGAVTNLVAQGDALP